MDKSDVSPAPASPFIPMFEQFRDELDEHHDRRERIIKASRDITAASKKIIFALQRVSKPAAPLPANIAKSIQPHLRLIAERFASVVGDLQNINFYRYAQQITGGIQEWLEAVTFRHYLETQRLLTFEEAASELTNVTKGVELAAKSAAPAMEIKQEEGSAMDIDTSSEADVKPPQAEDPDIPLIHEDYLLGIFDATGEMMRFAITNIATSGGLPAGDNPDDAAEERRTVVNDLQTMRTLLCTLCYRSTFMGRMNKEVDQKLGVMLQSVEKVERALYGLVVRGRERPEGWVPDLSERRPEVEAEA